MGYIQPNFDYKIMVSTSAAGNIIIKLKFITVNGIVKIPIPIEATWVIIPN